MKKIINFFKKIFKVHSPSEEQFAQTSPSEIEVAYKTLDDVFKNNKLIKADLRNAIVDAMHHLANVIHIKSARINSAYDRLFAAQRNSKATKADLRLAIAMAKYYLYLEMYGEVRE